MPVKEASIARYFADLPDPRIDRTKKHSLGDILVIATMCRDRRGGLLGGDRAVPRGRAKHRAG